MPCRQITGASPPSYLASDGPLRSGTAYRTEAECNQACQEGACCEGTTCTVKPQCQCQGAGQTFNGVGTTCASVSSSSCCNSQRAIAINVTFEGWTECRGTGERAAVDAFSVSLMPSDWSSHQNGGHTYYLKDSNGQIEAGQVEIQTITHSFTPWQQGDFLKDVPGTLVLTQNSFQVTRAFIGLELRKAGSTLTCQMMDAYAERWANFGMRQCGQSGTTIFNLPCVWRPGGRVLKQSPQTRQCSEVLSQQEWDWIVGSVYENTFEAFGMNSMLQVCVPPGWPENPDTSIRPGFRYYGKLKIDSIQYL